MRVYLDLDEVLVDFVGGACKLFGLTYEQVRQHWVPGEWSINNALGKALGLGGPLPEDELWGRIDNNTDFWLNLSPLPWADDMLQLVKTLADEWYIVSSPSRCETSYLGKLRWLARKFGPSFDNYVLTSHKHLLDKKRSILIDDKDSTIDKFCLGGGIGIVFPRHNNRMHSWKDRPFKYVEQLLRYWIKPRPVTNTASPVVK